MYSAEWTALVLTQQLFGDQHRNLQQPMRVDVTCCTPLWHERVLEAGWILRQNESLLQQLRQPVMRGVVRSSAQYRAHSQQSRGMKHQLPSTISSNQCEGGCHSHAHVLHWNDCGAILSAVGLVGASVTSVPALERSHAVKFCNK